MQARSSYVRLIYEGKNITQDIAPFLTQFTFTDNSGGKADDISLTLEDRNSLWASDWIPQKGDKIQADIIKLDGAKAVSLPCGIYEVDQIDYSAPPRLINIKGISTAISKNMRHERHNQTWENITLQAIAAEIAGKNSLALYYDGANPFFERKTQSGISDIEFLQNLCSDFGLNLKIHDNKLIIYDVEQNSQNESVCVINIDQDKIISWKFSSKSMNVYKKARVNYHDPIKNESFSGEYEDANEEGSNEILEINERVESDSEAKIKAEKKLQQANRREITGEILLMGSVDFLAGNNITIQGFGAFDGKYMIETVTHSVGNGFTSSLKLTMGGSSKSKVKAKKSNRKTQAAKKAKTPKVTQQKQPELFYEGNKYYGAE